MPLEIIRSPDHDRARSLGWLATQWIEHFVIHGPGDIQGASMDITVPGAIPLSDELVELTVDVYALDAAGRRLYDSAFFSRPKGADKSGHAGRLGLFEALGPCRFAGWAEGGEVFEWLDFRYEYQPGEPIGRVLTYPFLRILATEEEQAGNVYDTMRFNLVDGPLREAFARKDDVGLTRVYLPGGGEIRPSTASNAAKDGGLESCCVFDESHLYYTPELRRMHATVRRNLTKRMDAEPWSLETSTMYLPGQDSIAERSHERAMRIREGKLKMPRAYFNHRQAPPDTDLADEQSLRAGLVEAYGDAASYLDLDRKVAEIWDPVNDPSESRRYYLNQVTAHSEAWVSPQEWDVLAKPDHVVPAGALITLGLDGSRTDDHTALVACEVESGHLWPVGIWDPAEHDDHVVPRDAVRAAVAQARLRFDVVGYYSDVKEWETDIDAWEQEFGDELCVQSSGRHPIAWDMRGRVKEGEDDALGGQKAVVRAVEAFHAAVMEGDLSHDGDPTFKSHVLNARRRPTPWGVTFGKEAKGSSRKVDALAAAVLARLCRQDYLALPDDRKRKRPVGKPRFYSFEGAR